MGVSPWNDPNLVKADFNGPTVPGVYVFSFFTSGILVGRLPIFFSLSNYILIPWLIKELFTRESALLLKGGFIAVYTAFFYYQVGVTWHYI